ncbi:hypothetical protein MMC13_006777 [Lambiella insularis]|nr:hypothetical protein [Lambiella insularis]
MRLSLATLAVLCVTDNILASAKIQRRALADAATLIGHAAYKNTLVRKKADVISTHASYVDSRRNTSDDPSSATSVSTPEVAPASDRISPTDDSTVSDSSTDSACVQALNSLNGQASNPSGMALCYNVLSFDNSTGDFESNLAMYSVSAATGDWAAVNQSNINVTLSYPGATVQQSNSKRDADLVRRTAPTMVSSMDLIGQALSSTGQYTDATAMMNAVMPDVALSAMAQDGTTLDTMLSNTEASFVTGVFSNMKTVQNTTTAAPATATPTTTSAATPFVLPGVTLGYFPVGLVVTGAWAVLFILIVGMGTIGRLNIRTSYRKRSKDLYPLDKLAK